MTLYFVFFFFKQKTAYEMRISDWSSDVCSSDLLVAMVINLFLQSNAMAFAISAIGVLLFAGLTAHDTRKIKSMYFTIQGSDILGKSAVMGALTLYLDFINLFTFLLQLTGDRR